MGLKELLSKKCFRCHSRRNVEQYKAFNYRTHRYVNELLCEDCAQELVGMEDGSWKEDNQEEALKW